VNHRGTIGVEGVSTKQFVTAAIQLYKVSIGRGKWQEVGIFTQIASRTRGFARVNSMTNSGKFRESPRGGDF
jgi:hypothetical protein